MAIQFNTPQQYLFIHERVKHLLILWKQEQITEIYIVEEENGNDLLLRHPGRLYVERLIQQLDPIFFLTIDTGSSTVPLALGATFYHNKKLIGYYVPSDPSLKWETVYFFEISDQRVINIPDQELSQVIHSFRNEFPETT